MLQFQVAHHRRLHFHNLMKERAFAPKLSTASCLGTYRIPKSASGHGKTCNICINGLLVRTNIPWITSPANMGTDATWALVGSSPIPPHYELEQNLVFKSVAIKLASQCAVLLMRATDCINNSISNHEHTPKSTHRLRTD